MVEKVGIVSAKVCTAQCNFCVLNTKHTKNKVRELPAPGRKVMDIKSPEYNRAQF
jgi:wyosine [tRNA(Phe)-imidazoG37] synthetase (radical SAM superfamily)